MLTAQLLDLEPLIWGNHRSQTWHADSATVEPEITSTEITELNAVTAIDAVLQVYPRAIWTVDGEFGRIVAGDRLVSLPFSVVDSDAELCAWIDASQRLGNGDLV